MVKKYVPVIEASVDGVAQLAATIEAGTRQTSAHSFAVNQDTMIPGGVASFARASWVPLDPTADNLEILGLDASESSETYFVRLKILFNTSADKFLHFLDGSATIVADRFSTPGGSVLTMGPLGLIVVYYDAQTSRWQVVSSTAIQDLWESNSLMVQGSTGRLENVGLADKEMLIRLDALSGLATVSQFQVAHFLKEGGALTNTITSGTQTNFGGAVNERRAWFIRFTPTGRLLMQGISESGIASPFDSALVRRYVNDGTAASMMVFQHLVGSSTLKDIVTPDGLDYYLRPGEAVTLVRDLIEEKWRIIEPSRAHDQAFRFKVSTTTATATTCGQYTTHTDERAISLRVTIIGRELTTDDTCKYVIEAIVNRAAGGGLSIKNQIEVYAFEDQTAWGAILDVSGNDVRARVTGEGSKNIEWKTSWEVMEHG